MKEERIINHIKNKLEQIKKCYLYYQKAGQRHMQDIYHGEIIALERLLEVIENGEN